MKSDYSGLIISKNTWLTVTRQVSHDTLLTIQLQSVKKNNLMIIKQILLRLI